MVGRVVRLGVVLVVLLVVVVVVVVIIVAVVVFVAANKYSNGYYKYTCAYLDIARLR